MRFEAVQGEAVRDLVKILFDAAARGDVAGVEEALAAGADPGAHVKDGVNALYTSIFHDQPDVARALVAGGADVDQVFSTQMTPLTFAAWLGRNEIVEILLNGGAKLEAVDAKEGATALWWAANGRQADTVELLLRRGASTDTRDRTVGFTALMCAITNTETERVVPRLVELTPNLDYLSNSGESPLVAAALAGKAGLVKVLLDAGADPNFGNEGDRPLDCFMFGPPRHDISQETVDQIVDLLRARGGRRSDET